MEVPGTELGVEDTEMNGNLHLWSYQGLTEKPSLTGGTV